MTVLKQTKLPRAFYDRDTLVVARELLGKYLVFLQNGQEKIGRIVETEAYKGFDDTASHAHGKKTPRNAIMYGPSGFAYIYIIYGIYHCLNLVTEKEGYPAAVLIRALELPGAEGPGKLCRVFGMTREQNGLDLLSDTLHVLVSPNPKEKIVATSRIGVDYAGSSKDLPWRFYLEGNLFVSRPSTKLRVKK